MTMFFEFPARSGGTGLLLLRLSAAGSLIATHLSSPDLPPWRLCLAVLIAIGLCIGLRTRLLCGLSVLALVGHVAVDPAALTLAIPSITDTVALALVGPGAFSVDARLFGRRTIILPNDRDTIV
jgi:hypothetical protein